MRAVLSSVNAGTKHNVTPKRKRKLKISENSDEAKVVYHCEETGLSDALTTYMVNTFRANQLPPQQPLSYSAIKTFVSRSPIIDKSKRRSKKSGKTDPRAHWSVARLAQMKQFKKMLELGTIFFYFSSFIFNFLLTEKYRSARNCNCCNCKRFCRSRV